MNGNNADAEKGALLTVWVLWVAMLGSLGACLPIERSIYPAMPSLVETNFQSIFAMTAFGIGLTLFVLRPLLFSRFKGDAWYLLTPAGRGRLIIYNLICFALAESVGVLGLVLRFLGWPVDICDRFLIAALALLVWLMPLASRFSPNI
jgi:hypothetical protein